LLKSEGLTGERSGDEGAGSSKITGSDLLSHATIQYGLCTGSQYDPHNLTGFSRDEKWPALSLWRFLVMQIKKPPEA